MSKLPNSQSESALHSYEDGPIAIFGAGLSGQGVAALCAARRIEHQVFDEVFPGAKAKLEPGDLELFKQFVFSPGFSPGHPWRKAVRAQIVPECIWGELAFAAQFWNGPILGITGTNGKSSVTQLLCAALRADGRQAAVCGNIGRAFADVVCAQDAEIAVAEISSFQADLSRGLRLDGLIWTNFAPDHLDYHGGAKAYFEAKLNLFDRLKPGAPCVVGETVFRAADKFGIDLPTGVIEAADEEASTAAPENSVFAHGPQAQNFPKVAKFADAWGISRAALNQAAREHKLAPHRLAPVSTVDGITFWNDSKATNPDAALAALKSFDKPLLWIAGGRDKSTDLKTFAEAAAQHLNNTRSLVLVYGSVGFHFGAELETAGIKVIQHNEFASIVTVARELALQNGLSAVLLSPGFASFDQFASYADRGKSFVSQVLSLKRCETNDNI